MHYIQKPLHLALSDPQLIVMTDYGKMTRHQTLHKAFQALHGFVKEQERLPKPWSEVSRRDERDGMPAWQNKIIQQMLHLCI